MSLLKRLVYMGFGAALVLALVVAGVVVFAQSGDDGATPDSQDGATDEVTPQFRPGPFRQGDGPNDDNQQLLADALGISVEELQAAYDQVRLAVIQQAVDEGLITEEQARQLQESDRPFRAGHLLRGLVVNEDELLADALGIGVDELRDARNEARQARLDALVEAGRLTQEQADAIAAREAVSSYIDREALAQAIRDAYEAAVNAALDAGAITQEQADRLLENAPAFGAPGFGPFGFGGGPGHHGRIHGPAWGGKFVPGARTAAPATDAAFDA